MRFFVTQNPAAATSHLPTRPQSLIYSNSGGRTKHGRRQEFGTENDFAQSSTRRRVDGLHTVPHRRLNLLGDGERAALLYKILLPLAGRNVGSRRCCGLSQHPLALPRGA